MTEKNHTATGTFTKGNQAANRNGLYQRLRLSRPEHREMARVRKVLEASGVAKDIAGGFAVQWAGARRIAELFFRAETDEEKLELWPVFERASMMQNRVLFAQSQALGQVDDGDGSPRVDPEPMWKKADRVRESEGGETE